MPIIHDEATPTSVALPLAVEICRHPAGGRWEYDMGGSDIRLDLHFDPVGASSQQLMEAVVDVIGRALATSGETLGDVAFIDIRYVGDDSRGCTGRADDEYVGDEMSDLIDRLFGKSKLYLAREREACNCDPELAAYVRDALIPPMREAA